METSTVLLELTGDEKWPFSLIDNKWGTYLEFNNEKEVITALKFSKNYVKKWKDINITKFPKKLSEKLKVFSKKDLYFLETDDIKWLAK